MSEYNETNRRYTATILAIGCTLLLAGGCGSQGSGSGSDSDPQHPKIGLPEPGDTSFLSANPDYQGPSDGWGDSDVDCDTDSDSDSDADGGDADADSDTDGDAVEEPVDDIDPELAIEEADIVKVVGDTLYALSRYRGLFIIDISDPSNLLTLGRHQVSGQPFEMYVRDGIVLPLYTSFTQWVFNEEEFSYEYQLTSRIIALDVTDPSAIEEVGHFELPGDISDSRIVGDILYAVSFENGYCYMCDGTPKTTITSLDISDPGEPSVVDQLSYEEEDSYYSWRRSIEVNTERMYVSGVVYNGDDPEPDHSTIQVVDISSHDGDLVAGASIDVAGQIESRWQMNEHQGVLRVVSQPGSSWSSGVSPVVETFAIDSAAELQPLGYLEMDLPEPENLMSVRFDGNRAYAVTFEQTDPLFVIDLSDPGQPIQQGELEIPGWLYHMEPRGDRLYAIGFDDALGEGIAVSLFDVEDPYNPSMLDRVHFGASWGGMPEDQDRIHKAFRILEEENLILMPFSGWSTDDNGYYSRYHSGIQLIDIGQDDLILRGAAPHAGRARRAFLHEGTLFAMSDERVEAFDIQDRDNPEQLSSVTMARSVYRTAPAGEYVVELVGGWWTQEARLEVYPEGDPDAILPLGTVDLAPLLPDDVNPYYYWWSGFSYHRARVFHHEQQVYVLWREYTGYYMDDGGWISGVEKTGVAVIDISDPTAPELVGKALLPFEFPYYSSYWGESLRRGDGIVHAGSSIVLYDSSYYNSNFQLAVVDLSDPTNPRLSEPLSLPFAQTYFSIINADGAVATSHFIPSGLHPDVVRFYLVRLDISDPLNPILLPGINIPGTPVYYSEQSRKLVTVDYRRVSNAAIDEDHCYGYGGYGNSWYDDDAGVCMHLDYHLMLLDVYDHYAVLRDRLDLDEFFVEQAVATDDSVFLRSYANTYAWYYSDEQVDPRGIVYGISFDSGVELEHSAEWTLPTLHSRMRAALGDTLLLTGYYPPTAHLRSLNPDAEADIDLMLNGYSCEVHLTDDMVISANGSYGVQTFEY